jgi:hypothetical protein
MEAKNTAIAAAMLFVFCTSGCNKTNTPDVRKNEPFTATPVPRSPAAATPPVLPPPPPVAGSTLSFSGEASRGQRFEKVIAPSMVFRLVPFAGNDSGWDIRMAPGTEPSAESIDCIGAILEPTHGSNELSIELSDEDSTQGALQAAPHEFDFVATPADCKQAWDLNNSINYDHGLTDKEQQELNEKLGAILSGHGKLVILDPRVEPPAEKGASGVIDSVKFEVDLQFPQPASPGVAKAETGRESAPDSRP